MLGIGRDRLENGMFKRLIFAVLLLTVGFAGGLVLTGRLQSAARSDAGPAPAPGTSAAPGATPASANAAPESAQARAAAALAGGGPTDFTEVAARTIGAVVNISSMQEVRTRNPVFSDPFFRQFFGGDEGGYSTQRGISAGSGVIISPNGYVLTNNHVVGDNSTGVSVILADKREKRAKLVGVDPVTDLALLKIDGQGLPTIPWGDSSQLKVAEWVLAIGNPYQLGQTVTLGIVSGTNRNYSRGANEGIISSVVDYIQTDAAINPGNSGGALINRRGELVGINTWIYSESGGYQGIGFAVPTNVARHIADELMKNGEVRRGTIGFVQLTELTPELAREVGVSRPKGLVVWRMQRTSPAYQAGLRPGDIVDTVDGQQVDTRGQFDRMLFDAPVGTVLRLGVIREGKVMELRVPVVSDSTRRRPQGVA
jgi:Do/DeqQ family serine protease